MPTIKLVIESQTIENVNGIPVGVLELQTTDAVDVPDDKWFVVQRNSDGTDSFMCVASVADFDNVPDEAPDADNPLKFWRTNSITWKTDYPDRMVEAIANTKRRIQATIDALKQLGDNPTNTEITFS